MEVIGTILGMPINITSNIPGEFISPIFLREKRYGVN